MSLLFHSPKKKVACIELEYLLYLGNPFSASDDVVEKVILKDINWRFYFVEM